jgi:hypothetical protein
MTHARRLGAKDYLVLKSGARRLLELFGSQYAAAAETRVRQQQLSNYVNTDAEFAEQFMPGDVKLDLETAIGRPVLTEAEAALQGYLLIRRPRGLEGEGALGRLTGKAMKENGDVITLLGHALEAGSVSRAAAQKLLPEIDEAITVLATLRAEAAAIAGEGE